MTRMAAIDRLVHHSIILEFDGPSQRIQRVVGADGMAKTGGDGLDPENAGS